MKNFIYLVGWPGHHLFKVGYTGNLNGRTGSYTASRGGLLLRSFEYSGFTEAFKAEDLASSALRKRWDKAFTHRKEAVAFVGKRGGGWTECYRVHDREYSEAVACVEWALSVDARV